MVEQHRGSAVPRWTVVVPVKPLDTAKSRLRGVPGVAPDRHASLALALALDTVTAVLACPAVDQVLAVTADPRVGAALRRLGARIVAEPPGGGLNRAFAAGATSAAGRWVAALTADLPALRPVELAAALAACGAGSATVRHFVADAAGTGTVLLTAAPGTPLAPRFGPGSAAAHAATGAHAVAGDWPTLRRDVDTPEDLSAAVVLGVGRYTAAVLGHRTPAVPATTPSPDRHDMVPGMQGTVATYDPGTRSGTLLLDDGREVAFPAAAFDASRLRLLRLGQRVRVEYDDRGEISRVTLPTFP